MRKVLVDTNVLINYSNGFTRSFGDLFKEQKSKEVQLFLNPIIVAEYLNDKSLNKLLKINRNIEFIDKFSIVDINKQTALIVGDLLRSGKITFIADAFIAASCLQFDLQLYTENKKDFIRVKNIKLFTP